jgi:hypothetical protein
MRRSAQSIIEVCIGIVVLIPVCLILIDLAVMLHAVELNDQVCRHAVRAAAAGAPEDARQRAETVVSVPEDGRQRAETVVSAPEDGRQRAETVVSGGGSQDDRAMVGCPRLILPVDVKVVSRPQTEQDLAAEKQISAGGPVKGTATVTTEIELRPFLIHLFCGGKSPLLFRATHTFPISCVIPSS